MGLFAFESKHAVKISKSFCGVSKSNDFRHVDMEAENNDALRIQQLSIYGRVPEECTGNIVNIESFDTKFRVMRDEA